MKMSDVFELPVGIIKIYLEEDNGATWIATNEQTEAVETAINNHDALVEALKWALERIEPQTAAIDQINEIKYKGLIDE